MAASSSSAAPERHVYAPRPLSLAARLHVPFHAWNVPRRHLLVGCPVKPTWQLAWQMPPSGAMMQFNEIAVALAGSLGREL